MEDEESTQSLPVFFFFFMLGIGAVMKRIMKGNRLNIPYTVALLIMGLVLGIMARVGSKVEGDGTAERNLGALGQAIEQISYVV